MYHDLDFFGPRLRAAGIPITSISKRGRLDPGFPARLRSWIRAERPDVLHAFQLHPAAWGVAACRGLPAKERPVCIAGLRSERSEGFASALIERGVLRRSDAVTVNVESLANEIATRLRLPRDRVRFLPNGIDLEDWDERSKHPSPFTVEKTGFCFALVGSFRAAKNHRGLLEALGAIDPERRRGWQVLFVGSERGGEALASTIRSEIRERRLEAVVRCLPETAEVAAFLREVDALVLPSLREGFPNVVLEAMASGIPCIATDVGEVRGVLGDAGAGIVVPRADPASLAAAMVRLSETTAAERGAMGESARRRVEERFSMQEIAARHLETYRALLSTREPHS